ncbi:MAG: glycogen debranching enzyme family protein [Mailhella sp.]|nr:glycogen debranching enzyme family protein [Mailhella sp.]
MEFRIRPDQALSNSNMSREWLLTNSRGDYASGSVHGCNTRRYHGLLASQTPAGRYMLLSTLEDEASIGGRNVPLSSRVHPGVIWPEGWRFLKEISCSHDCVTSSFLLSSDEEGGEVILHRSLILDRASSRLIVRYMLADTPAARALEGVTLTIRPLLNGRNINYLYPAMPARAASVRPLDLTTAPCTGFSFQPDEEIPSLVMQVSASGLQYPAFRTAPDWYFKVQYPVENERGYDFEEDLLMPGEFTATVSVGHPVWLSAGTEALSEAPETIWERHFETAPKPVFKEALLEHLRREADRFLVNTAGQSVVPAGYHWFGPWGRDTLIALPGLTFESGRVKEGKAILRSIAGTVKNGLVPNLLGAGNFGGEAYNSADASLWYLLAVHRFVLACPKEKGFIKRFCWPVMKDIIRNFAAGTMPDENGNMLVFADKDGLLHVGSEKTQLTWMDASINGVPVTPRHGCAVELNALWFDALTFAKELAAEFDEPAPAETSCLPRLKKAFVRVFCPSEDDKAIMGGGLYDTWRPGAEADHSIRPNQIFAVAVPSSPLSQKMQASVVKCVREHLLTPYGLRTLSPSDPAYKGACQGAQSVRDKAYHQGTVWPWPVGAYVDAAVKTARSAKTVRDVLTTLTPLFTDHLYEAGLGGISEILDGDAPHKAGGCISQAWSCAEALRLLLLIKKNNPEEWTNWLEALEKNASEAR